MQPFDFRPRYRRGEAVADRIEDLIELGPVTPDWDAIAVFLRLGYYLGSATPFAEISAVVPEPVTVPPTSLPRASLVQEYVTRFRSACLDRLPQGDFVMPMSGGLDSRHIAFELHRAGRPPREVLTADSPAVSEAEVAREVASHLGIPQRVVPYAHETSVTVQRRKNVLTDYCADEHGWALPLVSRLKRRTSLSFDGIAGDVLSAGLFLNEERAALADSGDWHGLAEAMFRGEALLEDHIRPEVLERAPRERAVEIMAEEAARHRHAANPVGSLVLWNRTRREIALFTYRMMDPVEIRTPYLDPRVAEFLLTIPASELVGQDFHREAFSAAFPDASSLPFSQRHSPTLSKLQRWQQRLRLARSYLSLFRGSQWFVEPAIDDIISNQMNKYAVQRLAVLRQVEDLVSAS